MRNNIKKQTKNWNNATFLLVLGSLCLFYPYEFSSVYFPFLPLKEYLIAFALIFVVCTISFLHFKLIKIEAIQIIFIQIVGFVLVGLAHGKLLPVIDYASKMLLAGLLLGLITKTLGLHAFYKKYNRWITIMAILGAITFFLVTFRDYSAFYAVPDRADGRLIFNYILTFSKSNLWWTDNFRFAGFFDEPGAMAYWGLFALIFNKLFVKDNKIEIILVICLLLTFSMGFYVQLMVYILFFFVSKKNIGKSLFATLVILVMAFVASDTKNTEYDFIYSATYERFETMSDQAKDFNAQSGTDNRAVLQERAYNEFVKGPVLGSANSDSIYLGDNIFEPFARYGILGSFFIYFPLFYILYLSYKDRKFDILKALLIIIIGFFHRPLHMNVLSFFIIYSMLIFTIQQTKQTKSKVYA